MGSLVIGASSVLLVFQALYRAFSYRDASVSPILSLLAFGVILAAPLLSAFYCFRHKKNALDIFCRRLEQEGSGAFKDTLPDNAPAEVRALHSMLEKREERARIEAESREEHIRLLEKRIRERNREMEQIQNQLVQAGKLAAVGELSAGVAHELNNPIGGILGYAQFLAEKMSAKSKEGDATALLYGKYIEFIANESLRCKKIIQNLLKFSRSSDFEFSNIDVNVVLADTVEILKYQMRLEKTDIRSAFHPELPLVAGDGGLLQQVFLNILINALKAIPPDRAGVVEAATRPVPGDRPDVEIRISDNGRGISKEHLDKIFDPFFTTRKTGEGTGLGLALSYGIIKQHRGEIRVESTVGQGTVFIIILPGAHEL